MWLLWRPCSVYCRPCGDNAASAVYNAAPVAPLWRIMQPVFRCSAAPVAPLWGIMRALWRGRMQVPPVSGTLSRQGDIPMGGDLNPIGQHVKKQIRV